ncbi:ATP-dependent DNA ligase [Prosthecomicrobium sp. N25]
MQTLLTAEFAPMEARLVDGLPEGDGWRFEPKWDGFRCLAFKDGDTVELLGKSGKPLGRYFPEIVEACRRVRPDRFVLDGELIVPAGETLSFEALEARLHPAASRVARLSRETPARMMLFDCLMMDGTPTVADAYTSRRAALDRLVAAFAGEPAFAVSPYTEDRPTAARWLAGVGGALDGVVAKRLDEPYRPGERAMVKVKRHRSADCVVGGFRYEAGTRQVGSLLLGLYDAEGRLDHVGFTSGILDKDKPALTARLEALVGPPGFDGRAPGGPSRWNVGKDTRWEPLRPEIVVEVRYDHVTAGRFRHGTRLLRFRPDKAPRDCGFDQIGREPMPAEVLAGVTGGAG